MLIDIIFAFLILAAIYKGYTKGFIIAIFSLLALIIGLTAAVKFSEIVAGHLGNSVNVSEKWLPFISFILVFLIVVMLIRLGAKMLEKTIQLAMMGWLNRLGGIVFYALIYIMTLSVLLFYATQLNIVKPDTMNESNTYDFIAPMGPWVIEGFGKLVPVFENMFNSLNDFFDGVKENVSKL